MGNLNNGEVHHSYCLEDVIVIIKTRKRWAGHIACIGEMRGVNKKFYIGNLKGRDH
jgi:hypothetical protein